MWSLDCCAFWGLPCLCLGLYVTHFLSIPLDILFLNRLVSMSLFFRVLLILGCSLREICCISLWKLFFQATAFKLEKRNTPDFCLSLLQTALPVSFLCACLCLTPSWCRCVSAWYPPSSVGSCIAEIKQWRIFLYLKLCNWWGQTQWGFGFASTLYMVLMNTLFWLVTQHFPAKYVHTFLFTLNIQLEFF